MKTTQIATADTLVAEEVIFDYLEQNVHLEKMDPAFLIDTTSGVHKEGTAVKYWYSIKMPSDHGGIIVVILEIIALSIFLAIKVFYPFLHGVECLAKAYGLAEFLTFLSWAVFFVTGLWGFLTMVDNAFTLGNYPRKEFEEKQAIMELFATLSTGQKNELKKKLDVAKTKIVATKKVAEKKALKEKQKELLMQFEYV